MASMLRKLNRGRRLWEGCGGDYRALVGTLPIPDQKALDLWLLYLEDGGREVNERLGPIARLIAAAT